MADPQPAREFGLLFGTKCAEFLEHDKELLTTAHTVCDRCGLVEQVLSDGLAEAGFARVRYGYAP